MSNTAPCRIGTIRHRADELFTVQTVAPRARRNDPACMPEVFNLRFRYNGQDAEALAGGGIYAILYRGELLYIGIFTGDKGVPFASDVASQRLWKHLEALTLRGRNIGFTVANYDKAVSLPLGNCALLAALRQTTVPRGNGAVKTYPCKVAFASENWHAFARIEIDPAVLHDFAFVYGRVGPEEFAQDVTYQQVKNYLSAVESDLIERHGPRCNLDRRQSKASHLQVGPGLDAWAGFDALMAQATGSPPLMQAA